MPSPEDLEITRRLRKAGETLGIPLLDHLVLSKEGRYSFVEVGLLEPAFETRCGARRWYTDRRVPPTLRTTRADGVLRAGGGAPDAAVRAQMMPWRLPLSSKIERARSSCCFVWVAM